VFKEGRLVMLVLEVKFLKLFDAVELKYLIIYRFWRSFDDRCRLVRG
jgi:hypothetical protein